MPGDLMKTGRTFATNPQTMGSHDDDENAFGDERPWHSLPAGDGTFPDELPSRPPRVWEAQPNLGRIWPVESRLHGWAVT